METSIEGRRPDAPLPTLKRQRSDNALETAERIRTKRIHEHFATPGTNQPDPFVEVAAGDQLPGYRIENLDRGVQEAIQVHVRTQRHLGIHPLVARARHKRRERP